MVSSVHNWEWFSVSFKLTLNLVLADDIIATVLAVEPMKFIYRGRIAVFSIKVLRDERICVIAEQRPDCSEEEVRHQTIFCCDFPNVHLFNEFQSFQWMSRGQIE